MHIALKRSAVAVIAATLAAAIMPPEKVDAVEYARNNVVVPDGPVLRCGSGEVASGRDTAVSIRHHDITLTPEQPADGRNNAAPGTVQRQIYLGSHRDYLVRLRNSETVRAVAPVNVAIPVGAPVWLRFPEQHCRALAR